MFKIIGPDIMANHALAELADDVAIRRGIPGAVDLHIQQSLRCSKHDGGCLSRTKAQQVGLTQADVANSVLTALSGSFQTSPQFWLNWKSGVSYSIAVQEPQYRMDTMPDLTNIPVTGLAARRCKFFRTWPPFIAAYEPGTISHYDVMPVIDIYGSVDGTDLRSRR